MKFLICFLAAIVVGMAAPAFKPGDRVEYKAYGKWEPGVVESELPGGKQLLIRRKPSEFYPKGDTAAYAPDELRAPAAAVAPEAGGAASARGFKPGDRIEYKAYGKWEPGVVESELPGGKQLLIRRKPSEFYPKGDTAAYAPDELRVPGAAPAPEPGKVTPATPPVSTPTPTKPSTAPKGSQPGPVTVPGKATGLLSKEAVIAYARQAMGSDPWGNPNRQAVLNQIRDYIKAHGTSFTADADFESRMNLQGTMSSHIGWAVNLHRGPAPRVSDYFGRWALTAANRGSHSYSRESGGRIKVTTTDSQAKSGFLEIHADGTYLWKMGPSDPPAQWLRGVWHESKPEEMNPWEAGPALWLENAKQNGRYMVRMGRDPEWPGWIDVGAGPGRTPVEYGQRQ